MTRSHPPRRSRRATAIVRAGAAAVLAVASLATAQTAFATTAPGTPSPGTPSAAAQGMQGMSAQAALTPAQKASLLQVAKDTWTFFQNDTDPTTHLPLDNLGPGATRGQYTSAANIGTYLEAVVSAGDLGIIKRPQERALISSTLDTVATLKRSHGFLFQWYDTTNGHTILNPGAADCSTETTPQQDNCSFLSAVDNGWYASGLMVARQALPELRKQIDALISPMDFSIFYDNRAQTACNTNPAIAGNQPTGQMYGGYYAGQGPAGYHNGAIYSDPRIAMYIGMGLHQMPGDVWWRTWRTLPPKQCSTDPDFSWQGQWPVGGAWQKYTDPQSGKVFNVWEGHYTYPGTSMTFLPTWGGGMFEAMLANEIVPETTWGQNGFGLADVRTAQVQEKYATQTLGYPVWGMSPSSTADDTGGYGIYGATGQKFPAGQALAQCPGCSTEDVVTPHASFTALGVIPQDAYANIQKLRTLYPGIYTQDGGFYDAVNPATGSIGHRRLVLDQSMIMMSLDNALQNGAIRQHFANDPASWAAKTYLGMETMTLK
ncbi:glucoamylase family protein [Leifsonia sp. NPDC056665]|uniref:glucoamylase family protein n=1 Tax=Leifsonia sp. NPDC056665 TaxID=3345901 RepID=UPI003682FBB4